MTINITRNAYAFEVKSTDELGTFEGYGSVFDNVDSYNDVMAKGAFKKSIKAMTPKLLWQHRAGEPIGVYEIVKEDDKGLYVKGRINLDVQQGREAYSLLKQGALTGLSIGYNSKKWSMDAKKGIRTLEEVDLWEISLVTFPANTSAIVTGVKEENTTCSICNNLTTTTCSSDTIKSVRDFESALRDVMGFSQSEAKRIASEGYKTLEDQRDVETELDLTDLNTKLFNATAIIRG